MGAHSLAWLALPLHSLVSPSKPLHRPATLSYSVQGRHLAATLAEWPQGFNGRTRMKGLLCEL